MAGFAVIVDTNVVVAGLLPRQDTSPVARVLDGMIAQFSSALRCESSMA